MVIGALLAASAKPLLGAIAIVLRDRPKIAIIIGEGTNEGLMPALLSGEIDLIVGRLSSGRYPNNLQREKLFEDRIIPAGAIERVLKMLACLLLL